MKKPQNPDPESGVARPPEDPDASRESGVAPAHFDDVRDELRRKGYLSHGVERYLLQDAVRPSQWRATVLRLALKLGGLGGAAMALLSVLLLAHWNATLRQDPLDSVPLFFHLLPLWGVLIGVCFVTLAGILGLVLHRYPGLRINHLSLNLAVVGIGVGLVVAFWIGWQAGVDVSRWPGWLVAGSTALATYAVTRLLYSGLLALAIRLTERTPVEPAGKRRWIVLFLAAVAAAVVIVPASLLSADPPETPSVLPRGPGGRVLMIGVDGVLGTEFDYLLSRNALPAVSDLLQRGGVAVRYQRPSIDPAALWTSIATGLPSPEHGVAAVDSFRPLGLRSPLAVSGPFRSYWDRIERPLGLAEHRPVLANRRSADTFWELAARGGDPILAVNWWSTYPARGLAGTVMAHGGYQLLAEGAPEVVSPREARTRFIQLREETPEPLSAEIVRSSLSESAETSALLERALRPEAFYRSLFRAELTPAVRAAAIYLPAIDLVAVDWPAGEIPFADLVRSEMVLADGLLEASLAIGVWDTVALVADPGRRSTSEEGRVVLWRAGGCSATNSISIRPEAIAAGLIRGLGLPQSRELPEPPETCEWSRPAITIESFGRREESPLDGGAGDEYLDSLRALGYL